MRFINRLHKPISLIALAMLLLATTATPVSADYNAKLGRFQQRDPNGQGLIHANSLVYHGANPTVTVTMAYELQFADGMNFYEYLRSNPVNATDPTRLFWLTEFLSTSAVRLEIAGLTFAAAHPMATRFAGGLVAMANLYAFAQYEEVQAIVVSQPNPLGLLAGEATAVRLAVGELVGTRGSITALTRATAGTQRAVTASAAFVRRSTLSFKPFTQRYFRENLGILTGGVREGLDAHHVFPVSLQRYFQAKGINIHDPIYGAWWDLRTHRGSWKAYNDAWLDLFRSNPTREQILQKGRELAKEFCFDVYY